MNNSNGGGAVVAAAPLQREAPVQRERDDGGAAGVITMASMHSLQTRQSRLEERFAACGIIFFIVNTGLLFLIVANYIIVVGSFVYTQNQLK